MDTWLLRNAAAAKPSDSTEPTGTKATPIVQGSFSARWNEKKRSYEVFSGGTYVTSATKEEKARKHLSELVAGTHKSQKGAGAGARASVRERPSVVMAEPVPKRRGQNQWGCKGKPEAAGTEMLSSPQKRARVCRERVEALEPDALGHVRWSEVRILVPYSHHLNCCMCDRSNLC